MPLDPVRDEQERQRYEAQYAAKEGRELQQMKKAVELLVAAGHLNRDKWQQAMDLADTLK